MPWTPVGVQGFFPPVVPGLCPGRYDERYGGAVGVSMVIFRLHRSGYVVSMTFSGEPIRFPHLWSAIWWDYWPMRPSIRSRNRSA